MPGRRCGKRKPAEFSAVRQRCERSTDSWWPWVYDSDSCAGSLPAPVGASAWCSAASSAPWGVCVIPAP